MSSHAVLPEGQPSPTDFKARDNPAFILYDKLKTGYEEQPIPELGPDEVLIEIKKTGICGSDVHFYNTGAMGLVALQEPMCLGHESSGILVQLGSNAVVGKGALQLGDKVALEPGVTCRMCTDCRGGCYQICEHMVFAAYPPSRGGTLQRYYKLPADLVYKLPPSVALEYGAMMEPLSVAVHAVANKGALRTGQNVLIFGAGPVGLLAMAVAKGLGAGRIVGVDINEERLKFAKGYAATDVYLPIKPNPDEPRAAYSLRAATDLLLLCGIPARGPGSIDLVVDATGAEVCIQMGLNAVRPGGTYVQTGFGPPDIQIPMFRVTTNEITIKGGWRYGNGDYPLAIDLVNRGLVNLDPLLTHTFAFKDALEAFEITKGGKDGNGKMVIKCVIDGPE
ncbi:chlorophyll synthesis pathway protein BchC [Kwoniella sp. CBS 9459]